jgi:hypothetical protein
VLFRRHGEYSRFSSFQTFFIFFIVLVSYSLYPGRTTLITSEGVKAKFFAPAMFLLFILGDLTGRLSCGSLEVRSDGEKLAKEVTGGIHLRVVFLPALLLCNVSGTVLPVVFKHDAFPYLFMALFSFTSGLLVTMPMMIAPALVKFDDDKKTVGALMTYLLSTSLLLAGSFVSFLSVRMATGLRGLRLAFSRLEAFRILARISHFVQGQANLRQHCRREIAASN